MTTTRPLPKTGDIYRHCKGSECHILAVSQVLDEAPNVETEFIYARHTETGEPLKVFNDQDRTWIIGIDSGLIQEQMAVYLEEKTPDATWARPLDMFLEVLGDRTTHYYRFEFVRHDQ